MTSALAPQTRGLATPNPDLLRGQSRQRRRYNVSHAQHEVELPPMMRLVFDHRAEPLPNRDWSFGGGEALLRQPRVGELGEQRTRLVVQTIVQGQRRIEAVGEFATVARIRTRPVTDGLAIHVALDRRQMPNEIAEAEFSRRRRPVEIVAGDAKDDATRPLMNALQVVEKRIDAGDLHARKIPRCCRMDLRKDPERASSDQRHEYTVTPHDAAGDRAQVNWIGSRSREVVAARAGEHDAAVIAERLELTRSGERRNLAHLLGGRTRPDLIDAERVSFHERHPAVARFVALMRKRLWTGSRRRELRDRRAVKPLDCVHRRSDIAAGRLPDENDLRSVSNGEHVHRALIAGARHLRRGTAMIPIDIPVASRAPEGDVTVRRECVYI